MAVRTKLCIDRYWEVNSIVLTGAAFDTNAPLTATIWVPKFPVKEKYWTNG